AHDMGIVFDAGSAGIGGPSIGFGGGARGQVLGDERKQAVGRIIAYLRQTDAPGPGPTVLDLDGANDQHLALVTAATAASERIVLAAAGNFGLVNLNQAALRAGAT